MEAIQLLSITPEKLTKTILEGIDLKFKELEQKFNTQKETEYLTRKQVSTLLSISLPTLHDWCKKGILKSYRLGNRIYFKSAEVDQCLNEIKSFQR